MIESNLLIYLLNQNRKKIKKKKNLWNSIKTEVVNESWKLYENWNRAQKLPRLVLKWVDVEILN
jgi:hypothetical protein